MARARGNNDRPGFRIIRPDAPPGEPPADGAVNAAALLELSDTLRSGLGALRGPPVAAIPTVMAAVFITDIPVACRGSYDAFGTGFGEATRRVAGWANAATSDAANMAAYDAAFQKAKEAAKDDLDETYTHVKCDGTCTKGRGTVTYELISAELTDASYGLYAAWFAYTWNIKVRAKDTFTCK
jgi:hypothetical protein